MGGIYNTEPIIVYPIPYIEYRISYTLSICGQSQG